MCSWETVFAWQHLRDNTANKMREPSFPGSTVLVRLQLQMVNTHTTKRAEKVNIIGHRNLEEKERRNYQNPGRKTKTEIHADRKTNTSQKN